MREIHYTPEELELIEYMETNPKSVPNAKERIAFIKQAAVDDVNAKKQVNFRMNLNDLDKLNTKSFI